METNRLLAHRVVPLRHRVEKTLIALLVYLATMGGLYAYHGQIPERFSREFLIAVAVSLVLFAFVIQSAMKHERATDKQRVRMIRMRIDDDRAGRHWLTRVGLNARLGMGRFLFLVGNGLILVALYIPGRQVFIWLTTDVWVSASVMQYIQPHVMALYTESLWVSGQRAAIATLEWLHISVVLGLVGALLAGGASRYMERTRDRALAARC